MKTAKKATPKKRRTKPRPAPTKTVSKAAASTAASPVALVPGQYFLRSEPIEANVGRPTVAIKVSNAGDRPIQVGSHFHFFEVNRALTFDRQRAYGMRLNIPAGTATRFEPGQMKTVSLVALGGRREVWGLNGLVNGALKS